MHTLTTGVRYFERYISYGAEAEGEVEEKSENLYGDVTCLTDDGTLVPLIFLLVHLCGCSLSLDTHNPLLSQYTDTITCDVLKHVLDCGSESKELESTPCYVGISHIQELEKRIGHDLLGRGVVSIKTNHWTHRINRHFIVRETGELPDVLEILCNRE